MIEKEKNDEESMTKSLPLPPTFFIDRSSDEFISTNYSFISSAFEKRRRKKNWGEKKSFTQSSIPKNAENFADWFV